MILNVEAWKDSREVIHPSYEDAVNAEKGYVLKDFLINLLDYYGGPLTKRQIINIICTKVGEIKDILSKEIT